MLICKGHSNLSLGICPLTEDWNPARGLLLALLWNSELTSACGAGAEQRPQRAEGFFHNFATHLRPSLTLLESGFVRAAVAELQFQDVSVHCLHSLGEPASWPKSSTMFICWCTTRVRSLHQGKNWLRSWSHDQMPGLAGTRITASRFGDQL